MGGGRIPTETVTTSTQYRTESVNARPAKLVIGGKTFFRCTFSPYISYYTWYENSIKTSTKIVFTGTGTDELTYAGNTYKIVTPYDSIYRSGSRNIIVEFATEPVLSDAYGVTITLKNAESRYQKQETRFKVKFNGTEYNKIKLNGTIITPKA